MDSEEDETSTHNGRKTALDDIFFFFTFGVMCVGGEERRNGKAPRAANWWLVAASTATETKEGSISKDSWNTAKDGDVYDFPLGARRRGEEERRECTDDGLCWQCAQMAPIERCLREGGEFCSGRGEEAPLKMRQISAGGERVAAACEYAGKEGCVSTAPGEKRPAAMLAKEGFNFARESGQLVRPSCTFFVEKPETAELKKLIDNSDKQD